MSPELWESTCRAELDRVANHGRNVVWCVGLPSWMVVKSMAAQLVPTGQQRRQIFEMKYFSRRPDLLYQAERREISSRAARLLQDCASGQQGGPRKIIKGERDDGVFGSHRERSPTEPLRHAPGI